MALGPTEGVPSVPQPFGLGEDTIRTAMCTLMEPAVGGVLSRGSLASS